MIGSDMVLIQNGLAATARRSTRLVFRFVPELVVHGDGKAEAGGEAAQSF